MEKKSGRTLLVILSFLFYSSSWAQVDTSRNLEADSIIDFVLKNKDRGITDAIIIDGDTVPMVILDEILFIPKPAFDNEEARRRYYHLKKKVYKVYPWAVLAGTELDTLNSRLSRINKKRQRKKYVKEFQDYLEEEFEPELRKLTRSEGQILAKLIYRETGLTAYELIKEYRSSWRAFWYNSTAYFYDISLKKDYSPKTDDEDRLIENILYRAFQENILKERIKANISKPDF